MMAISKDEISTTAMVEENNTTPAKQGFFYHWTAFLYCTIACLGGLQLGKYFYHTVPEYSAKTFT